MIRSKGLVSLVAGMALLLGGGMARGDLQVYEPFDYPAGGSPLAGSNGGMGFAGPWAAGGFNATVFDYEVNSPTLAFPPLVTEGERASAGARNSIGGMRRPLAMPLGTPGTTQYLSVLLRPEGTLHGGVSNGFFGLVLDAPDPTEPELFIGKPGGGNIGEYVIEERGGAEQDSTGVSVAVGETALLVLKMEFAAGLDTFTLYVNPVPGGAEPAFGTLKSNIDLPLADALTLYASGAHSIDEIRIGDTFADVTVVPEPAGMGVLALAVLLAERRRGRRG